MNYYNEIESYIKKLEINKSARKYEEEYDKVNTYWNIGKLIVEAQGGNDRAKYGNELIKKWSINLTRQYGKGYNISNLKRFRQFYIIFQKGATMSHQLTWSHFVEFLPIKEENKRNYYINECINNNLSIRELREMIKTKSYERLINKPDKIEIIDQKQNKYELSSYLKNPIIIKLNKDEQVLKEKDLEILLIAKLQVFFKELGLGFTLVGNNYKIKYGNKNYRIDILLFNYKINSFVVVELKLRELKKEDKAQVEFYMNLVDKELKENFHNETVGIIISKHQDKLIAEFVKENNITPINYLLEKL